MIFKHALHGRCVSYKSQMSEKVETRKKFSLLLMLSKAVNIISLMLKLLEIYLSKRPYIKILLME